MKYLILTIFIITGNTKNYFDKAIKDSNDWELVKNEDGIKVYTCQKEGSKIKEFKAITTVSTKMEVLEMLIEKVSDYPKWQANVTSARILNKVSQNEQYIYYTSDVPWPITDRDIALHWIKTNDNGTITYTLNCVPTFIEEQTDFLRIKEAKGIWQFVPTDNNKIEITYQFYGDPAGSLPNWIINLFIVDGPYETLKNIKTIYDH